MENEIKEKVHCRNCGKEIDIYGNNSEVHSKRIFIETMQGYGFLQNNGGPLQKAIIDQKNIHLCSRKCFGELVSK